MKFIGNKDQQSQFSLRFQEANTDTFPFIDILQQRDLTGVKFVDTEEIAFENIFQIKINVKKVGSVLFFFKKESFNKDDFVEEVTPLGEIESSTVADVIYKTRKLYEVAARFNPLFSIYCPEGEYILYQDCFETLINGVTTYYLSDYNPNLLQVKNSKKTPKISEKPQQKPQKTNKTEKSKFSFRNPLTVLKEDRYHYIFAVISAFLIGFTIAISIFDMYLGKKIYIFFIICAFVGAVLNTLIYRDTFVAHPIKSMELLMNVIISMIGYGLSIGGYFIFKMLAKNQPAQTPNLVYILLIPIAVLLLSAGVGYLIKIIKEKRTK